MPKNLKDYDIHCLAVPLRLPKIRKDYDIHGLVIFYDCQTFLRLRYTLFGVTFAISKIRKDYGIHCLAFPLRQLKS